MKPLARLQSLVSLSRVNKSIIYRSFSNMIKAKRFIYAKRFDGEPKITDFKLIEEELPDLRDGEYLAETLYHSVDPYMRAYMSRYPVGVTMIGGNIAKVIDSKTKDYPIGAIIYGHYGWKTHEIVQTNSPNTNQMIPNYILPSFGKLPVSLGLGVLGLPGNTAYFGFLKICQPKPGETVVVSGAGGAVGSLVGQIAKIKGCKVIGVAGTNDKCNWLTNTLKFDYAINYKTANITEELKKAAPNGVDCYFDNVGGNISTVVINRMNQFGRISVCGAVSTYNSPNNPVVPSLQPIFVFKQLKMEGFLVHQWLDEWFDGIQQMCKWVEEGKIKYKETETIGFQKLPQALIDMLRGENTGKAIVRSAL